MVEERVTDGHRIAELLASELHGRADGGLATVAVTDAEPDVEPSTDGTLAFRVRAGDAGDEHGRVATEDGERIGAVFVHPDRARVEVSGAPDVAAELLEDAVGDREPDDLRVRPVATQPPKTVAFVESGAATKPVADALGAVARAVTDG